MAYGVVLPRHRRALVEKHLVSDRCQRCGGTLYHDFDPRARHNGATCLNCGGEQVLDTGSTSLLTAVAPRRSLPTKWED